MGKFSSLLHFLALPQWRHVQLCDVDNSIQYKQHQPWIFWALQARLISVGSDVPESVLPMCRLGNCLGHTKFPLLTPTPQTLIPIIVNTSKKYKRALSIFHRLPNGQSHCWYVHSFGFYRFVFLFWLKKSSVCRYVFSAVSQLMRAHYMVFYHKVWVHA